MKLLSIPEYAKKYEMSENAVREMTRSANPPFQVSFSGKKAYIKDESIDEARAIEIVKLSEDLLEIKGIVVQLANHLGVIQ